MTGALRIVDLSVPLATGATVYPGDPEVRIEPALRMAAEGVNVLGLHLGSHSGTHVDAPYHVIEDGPRLEELPLERFVGPAIVLDLAHLPRDAAIGAPELAPVRTRLAPGSILLLQTGWSRHWSEPAAYRRHPWLSPEAADEIVAAGILSVGIDAYSVDPTPDDPAEGRFDTHRVILGAGGIIVENLTALARLAELVDPIVSVLPLRLEGADGAPVRAVGYERMAFSDVSAAASLAASRVAPAGAPTASASSRTMRSAGSQERVTDIPGS